MFSKPNIIAWDRVLEHLDEISQESRQKQNLAAFYNRKKRELFFSFYNRNKTLIILQYKQFFIAEQMH